MECTMNNQQEVKEVLKVENIAVGEKYLGLPTPEGRMGKDRFVTMKEKLTKGFTNWAERNMSSGAKEVLIKSVAQAIQHIQWGSLNYRWDYAMRWSKWYAIFGGVKKQDNGRCAGWRGKNAIAKRLRRNGFLGPASV
jgi:hypothetical protein